MKLLMMAFLVVLAMTNTASVAVAYEDPLLLCEFAAIKGQKGAPNCVKKHAMCMSKAGSDTDKVGLCGWGNKYRVPH